MVSLFTVDSRLTARPPENNSDTLALMPTASSKGGILVADDEPPLRSLLSVAFRQQGYEVWVAADGQEAVDILRREGSRIHLALLDVRMPGLDGAQTLQALRALQPSLPCCFMSGHSGIYSHEDLLALGAVCIFKKPFSVAEVVRVIGETIAGSPSVYT